MTPEEEYILFSAKVIQANREAIKAIEAGEKIHSPLVQDAYLDKESLKPLLLKGTGMIELRDKLERVSKQVAHAEDRLGDKEIKTIKEATDSFERLKESFRTGKMTADQWHFILSGQSKNVFCDFPEDDFYIPDYDKELGVEVEKISFYQYVFLISR